MDDTLRTLLDRFAACNRGGLARLISYVDADQQVEDILSAIGSDRHALRVGLTGSGGSGKSTLAGALVKHLRSHGKTVAVLACDPASPFSGGALLGDRVRLEIDPADPGVYFRSVSAREGTGGLSRNMAAMARVVEQFGFDVVLIETVGAGQDQLAVRELVDVLALVVTQGTGDDIQWEKAGVMEAADVLVVNKSDLPGADAVAAGLRSALDLSSGSHHTSVPVVLVSAAKAEGVDRLWQTIQQQRHAVDRRPTIAAGRRLLAAAQQRLATLFDERVGQDKELAALLAEYSSGKLNDSLAAKRLLRLLGKESDQ